VTRHLDLLGDKEVVVTQRDDGVDLCLDGRVCAHLSPDESRKLGQWLLEPTPASARVDLPANPTPGQSIRVIGPAVVTSAHENWSLGPGKGAYFDVDRDDTSPLGRWTKAHYENPS